MSDADSVYTVEKIVDHKIVNGETFFRIRWEGYFPEEDTWEPYSNICDCKEAMEEYRAEQIRNQDVQKQSPSNFGLPEMTDSDDLDAGPPNNSGRSWAKIQSTTSEEEHSNFSTVEKVKKSKKFRRISKVITSSDSDDEEISIMTEIPKTSVLKKEAANITMEEKERCKEEPFPMKISDSQNHGRTAKLVNKQNDLEDEASIVHPKHSAKYSASNIKYKPKEGSPKVISAQKPEKLSRSELNRSLVDSDLVVRKPKPKYVQKPEKIEVGCDANISDNQQVHLSTPTDFLKTFQIPKVTPKASDVQSKMEGVLSEPVLMPEDKTGHESFLIIKKSKNVQNHPAFKSNTKRTASATVTSAEARNSSASFSGIRRQAEKPKNHLAFKTNIKRIARATITSAKAMDYGASFSGIREEHKMHNKQLSAKFSTHRKASETITSASAKDLGVTPVDICDQHKIPEKQSFSKIAIKRSVSESIPSSSVKDSGGLSARFVDLSVSQLTCVSIEDPAYKPVECSRDSTPLHEVTGDKIRWSPQAEDDQSGLQFLDETSGASGSSKSKDGSKSLSSENSQLPPALADMNTERKVKAEVKPVVSNDVEKCHDYVKSGNYEKLEQSYSKPGKHDWEMVNPRGTTLLMQAAWNGRTDIVQLLLLNGADVNAQHSKKESTAMMFVCDWISRPGITIPNRLEIVKSILAFGGKLNIVDAFGETALMMASRQGCVEIVEFLLDFGADFYIKTKASPRTYRKELTAVDFAKWNAQNKPITSKEHLEIVQMISSLEARVTSAFEAQIKLVLNDTAKLLNPVFDTRIFPLHEDTKFTLSFDYEEQSHEPDTGFLLFVAHALFSTKGEVQCRMYGDVSAISRIKLNGVTLIGITEKDHVLSFCPVNEGENRLEFITEDMQNSDVKLIVRAYRVQVLP